MTKSARRSATESDVINACSDLGRAVGDRKNEFRARRLRSRFDSADLERIFRDPVRNDGQKQRADLYDDTRVSLAGRWLRAARANSRLNCERARKLRNEAMKLQWPRKLVQVSDQIFDRLKRTRRSIDIWSAFGFNVLG